jgi:hypothetical protein
MIIPWIDHLEELDKTLPIIDANLYLREVQEGEVVLPVEVPKHLRPLYGLKFRLEVLANKMVEEHDETHTVGTSPAAEECVASRRKVHLLRAEAKSCHALFWASLTHEMSADMVESKMGIRKDFVVVATGDRGEAPDRIKVHVVDIGDAIRPVAELLLRDPRFPRN